jgi:hypothetical protein
MQYSTRRILESLVGLTMEEHLAERFLWSVGLLRVRDVGLLLCEGLPRGAGLLRDGALDFLDLTVLFTGLVFLYLPRSDRFADMVVLLGRVC